MLLLIIILILLTSGFGYRTYGPNAGDASGAAQLIVWVLLILLLLSIAGGFHGGFVGFSL